MPGKGVTGAPSVQTPVPRFCDLRDCRACRSGYATEQVARCSAYDDSFFCLVSLGLRGSPAALSRPWLISAGLTQGPAGHWQVGWSDLGWADSGLSPSSLGRSSACRRQRTSVSRRVRGLQGTTSQKWHSAASAVFFGPDGATWGPGSAGGNRPRSSVGRAAKSHCRGRGAGGERATVAASSAQQLD